MINENTFEKEHIEHGLQAEKELEKIKIVEAKMIDKYDGYEELKSFVVYLSAMERIFARARIFDASPTTIKEEIIKEETRLFSQDVSLDEEILKSIRDDFSLLYATVSQICDIAEKLLQKFVGHKNCQKFIGSLRDIAIVFIESHEKHFSINEIQEKIYRSQMKNLSADGDPKLAVLEQVYAEFKAEIEKLRK
jgi:hypothetical protein